MNLFVPRSISSLRGELVPYLVRKQFTNVLNSQMDDKQTEQNLKKIDANSFLGKLPSDLFPPLMSYNNQQHSIETQAYTLL